MKVGWVDLWSNWNITKSVWNESVMEMCKYYFKISAKSAECRYLCLKQGFFEKW